MVDQIYLGNRGMEMQRIPDILGQEPLVSGGRETPPLNTRRMALRPGQRVIDEHNVTHLPFAPWCEICVRTRSANHPHKRRTEENGDSETPKVYFDYGFFRSRVSTPLVPFLVGVCKKTNMKFTSVVRDRRGRRPLTITQVKKGLSDLGIHGEITLRADGEAALLDLLRAGQKRDGPGLS